jgi:hypothetical protein
MTTSAVEASGPRKAYGEHVVLLDRIEFDGLDVASLTVQPRPGRRLPGQVPGAGGLRRWHTGARGG